MQKDKTIFDESKSFKQWESKNLRQFQASMFWSFTFFLKNTLYGFTLLLFSCFCSIKTITSCLLRTYGYDYGSFRENSRAFAYSVFVKPFTCNFFCPFIANKYGSYYIKAYHLLYVVQRNKKWKSLLSFTGLDMRIKSKISVWL